MLFVIAGLGGCSSGLPLRLVDNDKADIIITDASAVMTMTRARSEGVVTCSRMNADVSVDRASSLSLSTLNLGKDRESNGEMEAELQGRTPGLLAMRDGLYHACLLYQSGAITSNELLNMTSVILERSYDLLELEAGNSRWAYDERANYSQGNQDRPAMSVVSGESHRSASQASAAVPTITLPASPRVSADRDDFVGFD